MLKKILSQQWLDAGLEKGDTVLIHSSLKRTLLKYKDSDEKINPTIILESFLAAVGQDGTVLLPLFNFDFTEGKTFDIRNTPSQMGALSEVGRLYHDAIRTGHPIYSFAAIGAKAEVFRGVNNFSAYGSDSPFDILRRLDGKIAILDLEENNSMTFTHYVEEMNRMDIRYHKTFTGKYFDEEGIITTRSYQIFVRDLEKGVVTNVNPLGELFWKNGLYKGDRPKVNSGLRVVLARNAFIFESELIADGKAKGLLYEIEGEDNK